MNPHCEHADATPLQALSDSIASIVEQVGRSTVAVRGRGRHALGCAVAWRPGILVAAAHVFARAPAAASAIGAQGAGVDLALAGTDVPTDLAVFRLPDASLPAVERSDASQARAGQLAVLVGRAQDAQLTASVAAIHRVAGRWQTWLGGHIDRLIRLDGGLHDGLSGAPVADPTGRVIGIATAALSRSHAIVVPGSTIERVVDELLARGHVARAFLGISAQPVAVPQDAPAGQRGSGLLITSLLPGGPAAQAGLLVGDIVVDVAEQRAASVAELRDALKGQIGQRVRVSLIRGGAPAGCDVVVGQWPAEAHAG